MMPSANLYAAILGLTFLISSGVALSQDGGAGQSHASHSGASGAVNPDKIDDAILKQTAKAYVKVSTGTLSSATVGLPHHRFSR